MFFGNKKCDQCQSEYDVALPTCPACGKEDANYQNTKLPLAVSWMPWWKQLIVFLIGSVGLSIAATIVSLIAVLISGGSDNVTTGTAFLVDLIGYVIILVGMGAVLFPHYKGLLKSFKRWQPYLLGLAGAGVLYLFSVLYGVILQVIPFETTDNANQSLVVEFLKSNPAVGFILISILGPVAEELTYRVGLFTFGLRVKKWVAYVVVTVVFAFIHFDFGSFGDSNALINELLNLPSYLFAGLTFCFLYDKWGLAASLSAHVTNNLISCIFILL